MLFRLQERGGDPTDTSKLRMPLFIISSDFSTSTYEFIPVNTIRDAYVAEGC